MNIRFRFRKQTAPVFMASKRSNPKPKNRDEAITLARYGKITPEEAEALAVANGWPPFERRPELPDFDPMQQPRWSVVMTAAWIAWRDLKLVRVQCDGFRSECTHWLWRPWNEPVGKGDAFARREGWFLETWSEATVVRLSLLERIMEARDEVPSTRQMTVREAEQALWRELQEGKLVAEALDTNGRPVDVPAREWSFLKLYEDGKRDVFKYDPLDRIEPFRQVKFKRSEIFEVWPLVPMKTLTAAATAQIVEPAMYEGIERPGDVGFEPFCSALLWIMTRSGTLQVAIDDGKAWQTAVDALFALIQSARIDLVGIPRGGALAEKIAGHMLAAIKVLAPLSWSINDIAVDAPSHISCSISFNREEWLKDFNDELYCSGQPKAAWTHLQVRKDQILARWPRAQSRIRPEMDCYHWLLAQIDQSPECRPKPKEEFWEETKQKFSPLKHRQFHRAWDKALSERPTCNWSKPGPLKKSDHRNN